MRTSKSASVETLRKHDKRMLQHMYNNMTCDMYMFK